MGSELPLFKDIYSCRMIAFLLWIDNGVAPFSICAFTGSLCTLVLFRLRPLRPVFARTYSIPKLNGVKIDEYRPTCDTHYRLPRTSDSTTFVWYALLHPFVINDNYWQRLLAFIWISTPFCLCLGALDRLIGFFVNALEQPY